MENGWMDVKMLLCNLGRLNSMLKMQGNFLLEETIMNDVFAGVTARKSVHHLSRVS